MVKQPQKTIEKNSSIAFFFLLLYTASVLIRPHEMRAESVEWITIKIFAIITFLLILVAQRPLKLYPQHWMLLLLVPLIVISGVINGSGMIGQEEPKKLFVSAVIPCFLFSSCITSIKRQHTLMVICLIAALLMVHNGYVQQTTADGFGWAFNSHSVGQFVLGERRITYIGFFNDPNDLGMFLVMNIPFAVYFYSKSKGFSKIVMLSILTSIGYGIYLTGSRGTMLGAGALIGVYYLVISAGPKLMLASVVIAPIAAVALTTLQKGIDESANQRLEAWYEGIHMLLNNPLFGVGKDNFQEVHVRVAHNSFIHIAGELGTIGYSLWGGALISTVLIGYKIIKAKNKNDFKIELEDDQNKLLDDELLLNKTLFFSMIGFMITAFFISRSYTLLLFIFLGMFLASHIRVVKLCPQFNRYFNVQVAMKSMGYCWVLIIAVYAALKVGL